MALKTENAKIKISDGHRSGRSTGSVVQLLLLLLLLFKLMFVMLINTVFFTKYTNAYMNKQFYYFSPQRTLVVKTSRTQLFSNKIFIIQNL